MKELQKKTGKNSVSPPTHKAWNGAKECTEAAVAVMEKGWVAHKDFSQIKQLPNIILLLIRLADYIGQYYAPVSSTGTMLYKQDRGRGKPNGKGEKGSVFSGGFTERPSLSLQWGKYSFLLNAHVNLTR